MPITADFHLHSSHSGDSHANLEEMIRKAISMGLKNICFTEHMDLHFPVSEDCPAGTFEVNVDSYLYDLLMTRSKYISDINVGFGIELGLQPEIADRNEWIVREHEFDFIIGSAHLAHGKDPYYAAFFEGRSKEAAIQEYFEAIYENITAFHNFDVLGHMDYVVRYAPGKDQGYVYETYREILDAILKALIAEGKGIELNTSGIFEGLNNMHPATGILKRYRELGGEIITLGSDAHKVEHVGRGMEQARDLLLDCGFQYYTTFNARFATQHKLA